MLKTEFERISNRQPMEMLSMKRYEVPIPSAGKLNDVTAWQDCFDNAKTQLEHLAVR